MSEDRQMQIAAWVSAVSNVVLTVGKGAIGLMTGSRALFADAVHSAADVAGSIAVIIGLRIARKPPDEDHPYGHGKAELISAAIVALVLLLASLDVGYGAVKSFFLAPVRPSSLAAWTAAFAVVFKEGLFQYNYRIGKRLGSRSLLASAYDHRSDVFSSLSALVGIVLSLIGEAHHIRWLMYMDPVASLFVAILVFRLGYQLAADSLQSLMDRAVELENLTPYQESVEQVPGVVRIDDLRLRDHGQYVIVDVEISVDASISVADGHEIASAVKWKLVRSFPRVRDVLVHVNPFVLDEESQQ